MNSRSKKCLPFVVSFLRNATICKSVQHSSGVRSSGLKVTQCGCIASFREVSSTFQPAAINHTKVFVRNLCPCYLFS